MGIIESLKENYDNGKLAEILLKNVLGLNTASVTFLSRTWKFTHMPECKSKHFIKNESNFFKIYLIHRF